ncbi:alpha-amylase family glycosyl hydrolase [Desulfobacca acetoxidans]|uniref:Alpha amylase catalytic region n=1 Tax=Desulfobacca acetoxidans (strain ATCC 700848 / DSM 11109 / ASRB2) TaxID=880072 RepID=F2NFT1_DESAR|nr:alpha-amylase family glycosyl hydrolase [Desulfobacca acetoxidans]AEB10200.1 alpha amylase catalytic region [Desulfobacca acetoxidans DSM 11109]
MVRYPSLYQINTRVWLRELGAALGRPAMLADIPEEFLDQAAARGFDYVWFLGLWQTGPAGRAISLSHPEWLREFQATLPGFAEADVSGSPFAVTGYTLHRDFGQEEDLFGLRERLRERGLKLIVDFVPNHTAPDHPWVQTHPEFYIQGSKTDLEREPHNYRQVETGRGSLILAHGRDPFSSGWPDTFQLNYRHPALREAMTQVLLKLAKVADGVRCDMAMLVLPEVFQRTWGERSLPADGSDPMDEPFWPTVTGPVKAKTPGFIFMAEVYWDLEWELMQQGFDYCYDKKLYDRLLSHDAAAARSHLWADMVYQDRLVRFMENHDEPRAAQDFSPPVHQAAAVITYCIPGLRFFHEGQLEGRRIKVSMHLGRRPEEPVDPNLQKFYRKLLACLERPEVRDGRWKLLEVRPAWECNPTWDRLLAFAWERVPGQRLLIAVNYGHTQGQCYVNFPFVDFSGRKVILQDLMSETVYERGGDDLLINGLYLDLPAWGYHILACDWSD